MSKLLEDLIRAAERSREWERHRVAVRELAAGYALLGEGTKPDGAYTATWSTPDGQVVFQAVYDKDGNKIKTLQCNAIYTPGPAGVSVSETQPF